MQPGNCQTTICTDRCDLDTESSCISVAAEPHEQVHTGLVVLAVCGPTRNED
jgi:hypothetical protein